MGSRLLRVKKTSSMWASSPIWASEASLARMRERVAKPRGAPLLARSREARFAHPNRRTCSQAKWLPSVVLWSHGSLRAVIKFGSCQSKWRFMHNNSQNRNFIFRAQRKSLLQLAWMASWSWHILAQTSVQLAQKTFWWAELVSQFFKLNSSKNVTCLLGKLRTEFTSPIPKSTSTWLSNTTFFARWSLAF